MRVSRRIAIAILAPWVLVAGPVSGQSVAGPEMDASLELDLAEAAAESDVWFENAEEAVLATEEGFGAFGGKSQDYWIAATQFHPRLGAALNYMTFLYFYAASGSGSEQFEAQVELPAGAFMEILECWFNDTNPSSNGTVRMWVQSHSVANNSPSNTLLATVASAGSGGYQQPFSNVNQTVRYRDGNLRNIYTLIADLPAGVSTVSFRGCRIFWHRQIAPAPGTASFSDVPTSHTFFQPIQALWAAGITSGCGGGKYCPGQPVNRAQMAGFLSAALGLHWPY